ncbi:MAG: PH domain-containing protein [Candidatus Aenigmarchaeota archaeon]|nr:PH domain-containing protein [Candidatus Aenigmarchaeota archaeon]
MKEIVLRRSRRSFFVVYIFVIMFILVILSIYAVFGLSGFMLYLLSFPAVYLFLLPEYSVVNERIIIKSDGVEKVSGIITKKKNVMPWNLVANAGVSKGVFGRMLDYGDISIIGIGGGESKIIIRGVSSPEEALRKIEEKMGKRKD